MFTAIFILTFVAAHVTAKIPSYINVCGRRDPNLDGCIVNNINNLKNKICEGIPELNIPPIKSMYIDKIDVINTDTTKISINDIYLTGLCDYDIKSFHLDLEKLHFDVDIAFRRINLNMKYDFDVNLVMPIATKGPIRITSDNVLAKAGVDFNMVTKDNKQYIYWSNVKLDINIKGYYANISSSNDAEAQMGKIVQQFMNREQQELLAVIKPKLEEIASKQILNYSKELFKHFTYDELFPDRT